MTDHSAEILFRSFLQEATVSSSGVGMSTLTLSIQYFFYQLVLPTFQGAPKDGFGETVCKTVQYEWEESLGLHCGSNCCWPSYDYRSMMCSCSAFVVHTLPLQPAIYHWQPCQQGYCDHGPSFACILHLCCSSWCQDTFSLLIRSVKLVGLRKIEMQRIVHVCVSMCVCERERMCLHAIMITYSPEVLTVGNFFNFFLATYLK